MGEFVVIKKSGDKEGYDEEKVRRTMNRVGVPDERKPEILAPINEKFQNGERGSDDLLHHGIVCLEP